MAAGVCVVHGRHSREAYDVESILGALAAAPTQEVADPLAGVQQHGVDVANRAACAGDVLEAVPNAPVVPEACAVHNLLLYDDAPALRDLLWQLPDSLHLEFCLPGVALRQMLEPTGPSPALAFRPQRAETWTRQLPSNWSHRPH